MLVWTSQLSAAATKWACTWEPAAQRPMHSGWETSTASADTSRLAARSPCLPTASRGGLTSAVPASASTQVLAPYIPLLQLQPSVLTVLSSGRHYIMGAGHALASSCSAHAELLSLAMGRVARRLLMY